MTFVETTVYKEISRDNDLGFTEILWECKACNHKITLAQQQNILFCPHCGAVIAKKIGGGVEPPKQPKSLKPRMKKPKMSDWVSGQIGLYPGADATVLAFIEKFRLWKGKEQEKTIESLFHEGYCYYFALMLQAAFKRGKICYAYDCSHIVWLDGNAEEKSRAYDITGVVTDYEYLIPVEVLGNGILDYMHIPGKQSEMTEQESLQRLLKYIEKKS